MNTTVDFQTAKELRDAGFPQPEPALLQQWYLVEERSGKVDVPVLSIFFADTSSYFVTIAGKVVWYSDAFDAVYAPTALDIIAQMPGRWLWRDSDGLWHVTWTVTQYYKDERIDACPHEAAAMAYIAWKKGQQ